MRVRTHWYIEWSCQTKISQFYVSHIVNKEILWFQIAMKYTIQMTKCNRIEQLKHVALTKKHTQWKLTENCWYIDICLTLINFGVNNSLALSSIFFKSMLSNSNTIYKLESATIISYSWIIDECLRSFSNDISRIAVDGTPSDSLKWKKSKFFAYQ